MVAVIRDFQETFRQPQAKVGMHAKAKLTTKRNFPPGLRTLLKKRKLIIIIMIMIIVIITITIITITIIMIILFFTLPSVMEAQPHKKNNFAGGHLHL